MVNAASASVAPRFRHRRPPPSEDGQGATRARGNGSHVPDDDGVARLLRRFADAYAAEMATHTDWVAPPAPDAPGEGPGRYGVCCNRSAACYCV